MYAIRSYYGSILRHIRHGRVRAIYSIGDAEAEVIEAQVLGTSTIAGRMVREIVITSYSIHYTKLYDAN